MERRTRVLRATSMGIFCAGLAVALLSGCGSDSPAATTATSNARGTLIEDPPLRIASLDAAAFAQQLGASPSGQQLLALAGQPACGVDFYEFQYWTVGAKGEPATASGALMVPAGAATCSGGRPIVLYAHGTTPDKTYNIADVTNPANTEGALVAAVFAAQGYIVVAPNYAGYDTSTLPYHPFLNADQQSKDMIDALAAARAALPHSFTPETTDGGKLFVTGYSEGGYVAMATVRAMTLGAAQRVTASAPMSGPYALEAEFDAAFFGNVPIGATIFAPLVTASYQQAYGNIYQNTTDIYEPQYAANIQSLLPSAIPIGTLFQQGKLPQTAIFSSTTPVVPGNPLLTQALAIPVNNPVGALGFGPNNLVTNDYRVAYAADAALNPDGATQAPQLQMQPPQIPAPGSVQLAANPQNTLRIALKTNDMRTVPAGVPIPLWAPTSPMLLCGGDEDPTVFFGLNTLTMAAYWTGLPTGLVTVLDVNAPPGPGDPFAPVQAGFQQTLQGQIASEGLQAAIASYHGTVAPFCTVAARAFFSQF